MSAENEGIAERIYNAIYQGQAVPWKDCHMAVKAKFLWVAWRHNTEVTKLMKERDELRASLETARQCVGFFSSVIKSGEDWTPVCEESYAKAMGRES